jgi:hypothetical protein
MADVWWLTLLQVTIVGNILTVEKSATHMTYILDDRMGRPVQVHI